MDANSSQQSPPVGYPAVQSHPHRHINYLRADNADVAFNVIGDHCVTNHIMTPTDSFSKNTRSEGGEQISGASSGTGMR